MKKLYLFIYFICISSSLTAQFTSPIKRSYILNQSPIAIFKEGNNKETIYRVEDGPKSTDPKNLLSTAKRLHPYGEFYRLSELKQYVSYLKDLTTMEEGTRLDYQGSIAYSKGSGKIELLVKLSEDEQSKVDKGYTTREILLKNYRKSIILTTNQVNFIYQKVTLKD